MEVFPVIKLLLRHFRCSKIAKMPTPARNYKTTPIVSVITSEKVTRARCTRVAMISQVSFSLNSDETVAIKVIDMRMLKGEVHKSLLASEIEVLKTFKHARNIIEVYDIYTTKNNTYIITEYCDGGDLSKFISSKRGMPEREAI